MSTAPDDEDVGEVLDDQPPPARRGLELGLALGGLAVMGALWFLIARVSSPLVLPSPTLVATMLGETLGSGVMLKHLAVTVAEILLGFALGAVIGLGLGIVLAWSPLLQRLTNPYLVASQAMPKLALAPIFTLWFGFGITSKVIIAALIAFFPLLENTVVGLRAVDRDKLLLFQSLSASERQVFLKLRLPTARPYIFAGLRVAMLFATVGAVVGEYVGADVGLGALIIVANGTLNTALMFAVFIVLTAVGVVLYKAVEWSERLVGRRRARRATGRAAPGTRS